MCLCKTPWLEGEEGEEGEEGNALRCVVAALSSAP